MSVSDCQQIARIDALPVDSRVQQNGRTIQQDLAWYTDVNHGMGPAAKWGNLLPSTTDVGGEPTLRHIRRIIERIACRSSFLKFFSLLRLVARNSFARGMFSATIETRFLSDAERQLTDKNDFRFRSRRSSWSVYRQNDPQSSESPFVATQFLAFTMAEFRRCALYAERLSCSDRVDGLKITQIIVFF